MREKLLLLEFAVVYGMLILGIAVAVAWMDAFRARKQQSGESNVSHV